MLDAPWGFDPAEITAAVRIWHGTADGLVPVSCGERLAKQIPGAELTLCEGEGHFLTLDRYAEIFAALSGPR